MRGHGRGVAGGAQRGRGGRAGRGLPSGLSRGLAGRLARWLRGGLPRRLTCRLLGRLGRGARNWLARGLPRGRSRGRRMATLGPLGTPGAVATRRAARAPRGRVKVCLALDAPAHARQRLAETRITGQASRQTRGRVMPRSAVAAFCDAARRTEFPWDAVVRGRGANNGVGSRIGRGASGGAKGTRVGAPGTRAARGRALQFLRGARRARRASGLAQIRVVATRAAVGTPCCAHGPCKLSSWAAAAGEGTGARKCRAERAWNAAALLRIGHVGPRHARRTFRRPTECKKTG